MQEINRTGMILKALGYNTATLAKALSTTPSKARRILSSNGVVYYGEIAALRQLTGMSADLLVYGIEAVQEVS